MEKFELFKKGWTKKMHFRLLFDKNEMTKLQKSIDKN
jgi:predicted transcriptional regulator